MHEFVSAVFFRATDNIPQMQTTTMSEPYFSVVVATYNRGKFIRRALHSIVEQTIFRHYVGRPIVEVTIVDDGSTDDTKNTVRHFLDHP